MSQEGHTLQGLEELRASQCAALESDPLGSDALGFHETAAFWNGFPPQCEILNPLSLKQDMETGADAQSPIALASIELENLHGPQQPAEYSNRFNTQAATIDTFDIGGLTNSPTQGA